MDEFLSADSTCAVTVQRGAQQVEKAGAKGVYHAVCHDKDGNLLWEDEIENQIMDQGKAILLDAALSATGYTTGVMLMGLVTLGSGGTAFVQYNSSDTYASHTTSGWYESTAYTGNRKLLVWAAASGGSKSLSAGLVFTINATDTIKGCCVFFAPNSGSSQTPGNTGAAGSYLLSAGNFTGLDKGVSSGDTITVSYTFTI